MQQFKITSKRDFIKQLFLTTIFDTFYLEEALILTGQTFHIDGRVNQDYYTSEELESQPELQAEFCTWGSVKNFCFDIIKGKKTPLSFKFVMHIADTEEIKRSDIKALVISIKFDGNECSIITGISTHTFSLDKTPEKLWDSHIQKMLTQVGIEFMTD